MKAILTTIILVACIAISSSAQPNDIEVIGQLQTPGTNSIMAPVYLDGFLYCTTFDFWGEGNDFRIYDMRDPAHIRLLSRLEPHIGSIPCNSALVLQGNFAYVVTTEYGDDDENGIWRIDISDPENPVDAGYSEFNIYVEGSPIAAQGNIVAFAVNRRYLTLCRLNRLGVLEVLSTTSIAGDIRSIAIRDNQLIVAAEYLDVEREYADGGLFLFDISNPSNPELISSQTSLNGYSIGFTRVVMANSFCVAISSTHNARIYGFDIREGDLGEAWFISDAGSVKYVFAINDSLYVSLEESIVIVCLDRPQDEATTLEFRDTPFKISPMVVGREDDKLIVANYDGSEFISGFSVHNIADPDSVRLEGYYAPFGVTSSMAFRDSLVAVTRYNGVEFIDVTDPEDPESINYFYTSVSWAAFGEDGNLIITSDSLLKVYNVEDPTNPVLLGQISILKSSYGPPPVYRDGFVYISAHFQQRGDGISIYDVRDAGNIRQVAFRMTQVGSFIIHDSRLYIGGNRVIHTLDISNPERPVWLPMIATEADFHPMAASGDYLLGYEETNLAGEKWIVQYRGIDEDTLIKIDGRGMLAPTPYEMNIAMAPDDSSFMLEVYESTWLYTIEWGERPREKAGFATGYKFGHVIYGPDDDESQIVYYSDDGSFCVLEVAAALPVNSEPPISPDGFSLSAFPNPFNSSVTIQFTGGLETAATRLAIYDLSGRLVADLTNSAFRAPHFAFGKVVWDARNLPAGIYFVKLTQDIQTATQKIVLMK